MKAKLKILLKCFKILSSTLSFNLSLSCNKELGFVNRHGIILVFIVVKVSDTYSYLVRHHSILTGLVQRYEQMVQRFLLIGKLEFRLNGDEDLLEGSDHIS